MYFCIKHYMVKTIIEHIDKIKTIKELIETTPNDYDLGREIRKLYDKWELNKILTWK